MMFKSTRNVLMMAGLVLAAASFTGCSPNRVTLGELRRNPSPELDHLARSHAQVRNDHARIWDNNVRAMLDDLDRLFLLDHNTQLTPYALPR